MMASLSPTYASDGNGRIVAFHGNQVIASGTDFEKVAATADEYFNELRGHKKRVTDEDERKTATHITTPNGETGVILGRTASVFADTITVRFSNGQIRHYDTFVGDGLKFSKRPSDTPKSPVEYFQRKLDEEIVHSHTGLTARLNTLRDIRRMASNLAGQGVSDNDAAALHRIRVAADHEKYEVEEALAAIEASQAEAITPPKQAYTAVEQADLGHQSGNWLDKVAQDMVDESAAQDFDKLLAEGPVSFVAGLETATLANTGVVRSLAQEHIMGKTAGFQGDAVNEYRDRFVTRTELARRREFTYRQDITAKTATKEAAVVEDTPDEALFL